MEKNRIRPVKAGKGLRMSYSRQKEVLQMPNLIEVQKNSYQWFLDEGLKEAFADISPITDYSGHLSLDFVDFTLCEDDVKYTIPECKERDATYAGEKVEKEWKIMRKTAERLKRNFNFLRKQKGKLSPWKMNIFRFLPLSFLTIMLAVTFGSSFGDKFMYQHAMKAPDEMRELHKQFYAYMKKMKKCGCKAKKAQ